MIETVSLQALDPSPPGGPPTASGEDQGFQGVLREALAERPSASDSPVQEGTSTTPSGMGHARTGRPDEGDGQDEEAPTPAADELASGQMGYVHGAAPRVEAGVDQQTAPTGEPSAPLSSGDRLGLASIGADGQGFTVPSKGPADARARGGASPFAGAEAVTSGLEPPRPDSLRASGQESGLIGLQPVDDSARGPHPDNRTSPPMPPEVAASVRSADGARGPEPLGQQGAVVGPALRSSPSAVGEATRAAVGVSGRMEGTEEVSGHKNGVPPQLSEPLAEGMGPTGITGRPDAAPGSRIEASAPQAALTAASGQPGGGSTRATTPATLGEVREVGPQGPATGRSERKTADTPTPLPDVAPDLLGRVSQDRQAGHPLTSTTLRAAEESVPSESAIIQRPALERHVGGQVLERLVHTVREGKSQVTLQLHPESLGRLQLQITLEDQRLQTRIVTESPLVRDLITAQEPGLRDALRGQGLTLEGLSVQVGGRFEHPGQGAGFTPGGPRLAPQPDGGPGAIGPGEPAAISSPRAFSQGRQLVDLFA